MTFRQLVVLGLSCVLIVGCGGDGKKSSKKGKKKRGGSKSAKVIKGLRDWLVEDEKNEYDWAGFKKRHAAAKKKVAKSKKYRAELKDLYDSQKRQCGGMYELKVEIIGKTSQEEANAQFWKKYLKQLDEMEKTIGDFDAKLLEAQAPKINGWRVKILKSVYKEDVTKWLRGHRIETDAVLAKMKVWKERLSKLDDADESGEAKKMMDEVELIEKSTVELTAWMQKLPPGETVNLLDEKHRSAWEKFGHIEFEFDAGDLVLTATGSKKETGALMHRAFWWTNFDIECQFQIEERGFMILGRAHPPKSGFSQMVRGSTFPSHKDWYLKVTMDGKDVTVEGDVATQKSRHGGTPGGGVGLFVSPGAKVRILQFKVTKR